MPRDIDDETNGQNDAGRDEAGAEDVVTFEVVLPRDVYSDMVAWCAEKDVTPERLVEALVDDWVLTHELERSRSPAN